MGGVEPLFSSITVARKCSECTETQNKYIFFSFIVGRGLDLAGQKLLNSLNWGGGGRHIEEFSHFLGLGPSVILIITKNAMKKGCHMAEILALMCDVMLRFYWTPRNGPICSI